MHVLSYAILHGLLCSFMVAQACAEHLVSAGFTQPSRMGVHVSSAGGLLGGVMANTRPDLFSAMVMKVKKSPRFSWVGLVEARPTT